jgi:hypothetical protein
VPVGVSMSRLLQEDTVLQEPAPGQAREGGCVCGELYMHSVVLLAVSHTGAGTLTEQQSGMGYCWKLQ